MIRNLNKFRIFLFVVFIAWSLAGCSTFGKADLQTAGQYTVNAALLAGTVVQIQPEIQQAEAAIEAHMGDFTPAEQAQLKVAKQNIDDAQQTVNGILASNTGASQIVISLSQIESVYGNAKASYDAVKPVIKAHEKSFTAAQIAQLKQTDVLAQQLDQSMTALETAQTSSGANVNRVIVTALNLAAAGARIAIAAGA